MQIKSAPHGVSLLNFYRTATRILFSFFFFFVLSFFLESVYVCTCAVHRRKRWLKCSWPIIKRCIAQDRYYNHPLKLRNEFWRAASFAKSSLKSAFISIVSRVLQIYICILYMYVYIAIMLVETAFETNTRYSLLFFVHDCSCKSACCFVYFLLFSISIFFCSFFISSHFRFEQHEKGVAHGRVDVVRTSGSASRTSDDIRSFNRKIKRKYL